MEINTIILVVFLFLILILLVRVISLQTQLNELKRDVERLENGSGSTAHSPLSYNASSVNVSPPPPAQADLTELDKELQALTQQGKKIIAIKKVREARNLSLKDAKEYVEYLERL
ncbi:ribosomal protein L7/L12 [Paenibacillus sp. NPDC057886]|uniref:ribosomal protein L7/L12 n=1 Tax=Paenibacillus sp. NPDC057886 TaxID=3346270 RepID=UPI0036B791D9